MSVLTVIFGILLVLLVLGDAFETVVFPRRVTRRMRLVSLFYRLTWPLWSGTVLALASGKRQENYLSYYGPLSFILLLSMWASLLVIGFAFMYWAPGNAIKTPEGAASFGLCVYFSGTTLFTLGLGDIVPNALFAKVLSVLEAGMGFAFFAIVISYLPALNQSFSKREVNISLLDARAGSPSTAAEILRRHISDNDIEALQKFLHEWERWSAELLESHLSYPVLVYFRSQHDNQSWLAALRSMLTTEGLKLQQGPDVDKRLNELRRLYEPYIHSISKRLLLAIPPWIIDSRPSDNWQVSAWGQSAGFRKTDREKKHGGGHF